jgi:hypothetical protein
MWTWIDEPWQYRVLDKLPPGIDRAQLERALTLTPTARLEAVVALMRLAEEMSQARRAAEPNPR